VDDGVGRSVWGLELACAVDGAEMGQR